GGELFASGGGQLVELGPAVGVGNAPPGAHELLLLETVQRLIERSALDGDRARRSATHELGDRIAVHRLPGERAKDEQVYGAADEVERRVAHGSPVTFLAIRQ